MQEKIIIAIDKLREANWSNKTRYPIGCAGCGAGLARRANRQNLRLFLEIRQDGD